MTIFDRRGGPSFRRGIWPTSFFYLYCKTDKLQGVVIDRVYRVGKKK